MNSALDRRRAGVENALKRELFARQETVGTHLEDWERIHGRVIAPSEALLGDLHKLQQRITELHQDQLPQFDNSVDITFRLGMLNSQVENIAHLG